MPLVMKFGGSSVADADRLRRVADLVRSSMGRTPLVVLSATGGTTNTLVAASHAAAAGRVEEALGLSADLRRRHEEIAVDLLGGVDAGLAHGVGADAGEGAAHLVAEQHGPVGRGRTGEQHGVR